MVKTAVIVGAALVAIVIIVIILYVALRPYSPAWTATLETQIDTKTSTYWLSSSAETLDTDFGASEYRVTVFLSDGTIYYDNRLEEHEIAYPTGSNFLSELGDSLIWGKGFSSRTGGIDSPGVLADDLYRYLAKSYYDANGALRYVRFGTLVV